MAEIEKNNLSIGLPDPTAAVAGQKKSFYKRWWFILLAGLVLYLLLMMIFLITGADNQSGVNVNAYSTTDNFVNEEVLYYHTEDDPAVGDKEAKVKIVEFGDFQCPFSKEAFSVVREMISKYGDQINYLYRDFPVISTHPLALDAAVAAHCANQQDKFWLMHDKIFINQDSLTADSFPQYAKEIGLNQEQFTDCTASVESQQEVVQDMADGQSLGVKGTPTFFINGYRISGAIPRNIFEQLMEELLSQ